MNVEQWQHLARQLEVIPDYLIWDTAEPIGQARAKLRGWDNASTFIDKLVPIVVDFVTDPKREREPFFDYLGCLWHEHEGVFSGYNFYYVTEVVKSLGFELLGRVHYHGMFLHGQILYRFWDMLADDVQLRKLTLYELEELSDMEAVRGYHHRSTVGC